MKFFKGLFMKKRKGRITYMRNTGNFLVVYYEYPKDMTRKEKVAVMRRIEDKGL